MRLARVGWAHGSERPLQGVREGVVPVREQVPVPVHRHADGRMAQPVGDLLRVGPEVDHQGRAGVPEIMEPQPVEVGGQRAAHRWGEMPPVEVGVPVPVAVLPREHERVRAVPVWVDRRQNKLTRKGYGDTPGMAILLLVNEQQADAIRGFDRNQADSPFDFIPIQEDLTALDSSEPLGELAPTRLRGVEPIGRYGKAIVVEENWIPEGYMGGHRQRR